MAADRNELEGIALLAGEVNEQRREKDPSLWEMLRNLLMKRVDAAMSSVRSEPEATKAPSFEEVFGEVPDNLSRADFENALREAGYDTGPRGFAQWGATDWEHLGLDARQEKMEAIQRLLTNSQQTPAQPVGAVIHQQQQYINPNEQSAVLSCPSGQSHGEAYQNRTREGKPFYKCRVVDCCRPGSSTTTTWDDANYTKRQEEFRTGRPYQPRNGGWKGRG